MFKGVLGVQMDGQMLESRESFGQGSGQIMQRGGAGMWHDWGVGCSGAGCGPKAFQFPRAESDDGTLRSANKVGSWDTGWSSAQ